MRKRSRFRRVAKWVGLVVCVTLILAATVSCWRAPVYSGEHGFVCVASGCLTVLRYSDDVAVEETGIAVQTPPWFRFQWVWLPKMDATPLGSYVAIPLWLAIVPMAFATTFLWHRDRPIPPSHCQKCGYDLTGNVSGVCPECGEAAVGG